jgi:hypothetical protein
MTIWFYVKTIDNPKNVGEVVCAYNVAEGKHPEDHYSWLIEPDPEDSNYWIIKAKFSLLKDMPEVAAVYRLGDSVVFAEIDNDLAPDFSEPLIEKYGFDNVKWLVVPTMK